jgi:SAM-dependent methyltransferase
MISEMLTKLKDRIGFDVFARAEITEWTREHVERCGHNPARVLDVGVGDCEDLLLLKESQNKVQLELYGVECSERRIAYAREKGVGVFDINVERESIPLPDASLDVLMANHVIEHLKELCFFFSEVSRVLRPGGICIIGCPNLGSWHNRLALLFGRQPPCMIVLGPHVRGITIPGFRSFIEFGGFFKIERVKGRAFYLAPGKLGQHLASLFPGLGAGVHFVMSRTSKPGTFIEVLDMGVAGMSDTPYYRGTAEHERETSQVR